MRILLVGASGTLGAAVNSALRDRHDVVTASRRSGELRVDITEPSSIAAMYDQVGQVDAVACAAGEVALTPLGAADRTEFEAGVRHKLLGQVELVRQGIARVSKNGSFSLITSMLSHRPVPGSTIAALVSGGLKSFVKAAALEMPKGQRINAISPSVLFTTSLPSELFPGAIGVRPEEVAKAYVQSIEGAATGQIYHVEEARSSTIDPGLVPELLVTDVSRSIEFWCGLCGFGIEYQRRDEGFAAILLGNSHVMLEQQGIGRNWVTAPLDRPLGRGVNFQITVPAVGPILESLRRAGYPLFMEPETKSYRVGDEEAGVEQFLVTDPDGYLIRFQASLGRRPSAR